MGQVSLMELFPAFSRMTDFEDTVDVLGFDEDVEQHRLQRLATGRCGRSSPATAPTGTRCQPVATVASQQLGRRISEISADRPSILRELGLGTLQVYEALSWAAGTSAARPS